MVSHFGWARMRVKVWFLAMLTRVCCALDIARVHELERLEEKIERGWDEMAGDVGGCEKELMDLQGEIRGIIEAGEDHSGKLADLEKAMEDVNELMDNVDLDDLKLMGNEIQNIKQWIDETNEILDKAQKLLKFHEEVEQGGWMPVMLDWRDRLRALEGKMKNKDPFGAIIQEAVQNSNAVETANRGYQDFEVPGRLVLDDIQKLGALTSMTIRRHLNYQEHPFPGSPLEQETILGRNVVVLYPEIHEGDFQEYVIVLDTRTGESIKVLFTRDALLQK